jgi:hypothetical protein
MYRFFSLGSRIRLTNNLKWRKAQKQEQPQYYGAQDSLIVTQRLEGSVTDDLDQDSLFAPAIEFVIK